MSTKKELVRYAQRQFGIADDGIIGPVTGSFADLVPKLIPAVGKKWTVDRKIIGFVQAKAHLLKIDSGSIDGFIGPQTLFALDQLLYLERYGKIAPTWRDEDKDQPVNLKPERTANPHDWPVYDRIRSFYGKPGSALVTITAPYPMRLAWNTDTTVSKITCHTKVATSLRGVLEAVRDHYGIDSLGDLGLDLFGGIYNNRKMRGGKKLSTHAWGVAIDIDPDHNQYKWNSTKARLDNPEYTFLRDAFASEGWVSLGEAKDYDWMHWQAVRV